MECQSNTTGYCDETICINNFEPTDLRCNASSWQCWNDSYCSGNTYSCPEIEPKLNGTACNPEYTSRGVCESSTTASCYNGTCSNDILSGNVCNSSRCYNDALCDGLSFDCPELQFTSDGTSCSADSTTVECKSQTVGSCYSGKCVNDDLPDNTLCSPPAPTKPCESAVDGKCNSGSCVNVLRLGTLCNASMSACWADSFCDGISAECPEPQPRVNGTVCAPAASSKGCRDNSAGTCSNGHCVNNWLANGSSCLPNPTTAECRDSVSGTCYSGECFNDWLPNNTACTPPMPAVECRSPVSGSCFGGECINDWSPNSTACSPPPTTATCRSSVSGSCFSGVCHNDHSPNDTACIPIGVFRECQSFFSGTCQGGDCINDPSSNGTFCTTSPITIECRSPTQGTCYGGVCHNWRLNDTACTPTTTSTLCRSNTTGTCDFGTCINSILPNDTTCPPSPPQNICESAIDATCQAGFCVNTILSDTVCNVSSLQCWNDSFCDGMNSTCPDLRPMAVGSACVPDTDAPDSCLSSLYGLCLEGECFHGFKADGEVCNASTWCGLVSTCNGSSGACPDACEDFATTT